MTASELARQLHGKKDGKRWQCRCPVVAMHQHGDRNRSLSVWDSDDGWIRLHCFTGGLGKDVKMGTSGAENTLLISGRGGPSMTSPSQDYRLIPLSRGQFAKIDESDFEIISRYRWFASWRPKMGRFYAIAHESRKVGNRVFYMHRLIIVDHINHDTLDNRRSNFRLVTNSENMMNHGKVQRNNTSGSRWVHFEKRTGRYRVQVWREGRSVWGGRYTSFEVAKKVAEGIAGSLHGEFASL